MSGKEPILQAATKPPDAQARRADLVRIRANARRPEPLESPHGAGSGHAFGHPVPTAMSCQDIVDEDADMCRLEARLDVRSVRRASLECATLAVSAPQCSNRARASGSLAFRRGVEAPQFYAAITPDDMSESMEGIASRYRETLDNLIDGRTRPLDLSLLAKREFSDRCMDLALGFAAASIFRQAWTGNAGVPDLLTKSSRMPGHERLRPGGRQAIFLRVAPVAQLDRALPSEGRGQRFESSRVRHLSL